MRATRRVVGTQLRESARVVRQRMGLLLPLPRPDQILRRAVLRDSGFAASDLATDHEQTIHSRSGNERQARLHPRGFQRSARWREVTDDTRIRETLPTLRLAIERGARLVSRVAPRPAQRESKSKVQPRAGGRTASRIARQAGGVRRGLRGRRRGGEEQGASQRRRAAPRKRPLSRRGRSERSRNFQSSSPRSATDFSFATRSAPRIARMLRLWASRSSCASPPPAC